MEHGADDLEKVGSRVGPLVAEAKNGSIFMLTRIHLKNFRAFRDTEIGPFNRVNLIAGLNNTGKTGLLEAIFLAASDRQSGNFFGQNNSLGLDSLPTLFRTFSQNADVNDNFWLWLMKDKRAGNDIVITIFDDQSNETCAVLSFKEPNQIKLGFPLQHTGMLGPLNSYMSVSSSVPPLKIAVFSTHPSDPTQDAIDYNRVIAKRGRKKVETLLRYIDPRLQAIESLQTGQAPLLYADIGLPEMIPVTNLGTGFCRLMDIYAELIAGEAKVLLIDEVENGLHHTVLPTVWKGLIAAANELDVQIFATTHSNECILAADQAARESAPYELNLIRLDRVKDDIKATVMDEKTIATAKELGWELR